jgi:hypothetical protein
VFDAVESLSVRASTLRRRLVTRRPGSIGTTADDVHRILEWHARIDADNANKARYGALIANAPSCFVSTEQT